MAEKLLFMMPGCDVLTIQGLVAELAAFHEAWQREGPPESHREGLSRG